MQFGSGQFQVTLELPTVHLVHSGTQSKVGFSMFHLPAESAMEGNSLYHQLYL